MVRFSGLGFLVGVLCLCLDFGRRTPRVFSLGSFSFSGSCFFRSFSPSLFSSSSFLAAGLGASSYLLSARPAGLRRTSGTCTGRAHVEHMFFLLCLPGSAAPPPSLPPSLCPLSLSLSLSLVLLSLSLLHACGASFKRMSDGD